MVAGEIAGAWARFGDLGAQLTNPTNVLAVALQTNQKKAAKRVETEGREWQQIARARHGVKRIVAQIKQPDLLTIDRVTEDQHRDFAPRNSEIGKEDKLPTKSVGQLSRRKNHSGWEPAGNGGYCRGNSDGGRDRGIYRRERPGGGCEDNRGGRRSSAYRAEDDRSRSREAPESESRNEK